MEVGGQLLLAMADQAKPMMLRDIAALAGMSAAKAHPYMVSFMRLGLVEQDRAQRSIRARPRGVADGPSLHASA